MFNESKTNSHLSDVDRVFMSFFCFKSYLMPKLTELSILISNIANGS